MDPALLPDITTTYEHMQRSDGTVGLVEKANSGRMSPIRKRSVKDVEQQIESLEKENFDLKLRIYFLEQQKGINKDDTLKVNIDLRVQLQSIHQEFQKKQYTWEQMMAGYETHIQELEKQINVSLSTESVKEAERLKLELAEKEHSLHEMEQQLHERAFESETQLQAVNAEISRLKEQLADRERQLITSPSQEELLAVKRSRDEKEGELKEQILLVLRLSQQTDEQNIRLRDLLTKEARACQTVTEKVAEIDEKEAELGTKELEVRALRDELTQKDFALRKSQIDLQTLNTSLTGREAELEKHKAEIAEKFNEETKAIMTDLESARRHISLQGSKISSIDVDLSNRNKELAKQEETINDLNNILHQQRQQIKALGDSVSELRAATQAKSREVEEITAKSELSEEKFKKDLSNLESQLANYQFALSRKDSEIETLRQRADVDQARLGDMLNKAKAALQEKDHTISSLAEGGAEKDRRIADLKSTVAQRLDEPDLASTPRDDQRTAINHLCAEIALLKKENTALKEGRPMEYLDDDVDLDAMSDNSETRDFIHSELAKTSVKAEALQAKLLELSREDIDGGSETSSVLREQVSALIRMRESDKKVIDALKKHISVNHGGNFDPEVLTNMAAEVCRLSTKIKDMHKAGQRSNRSQQSSRSQRSGASSTTSSVYKEEINHLRRELDLTRHEVSKSKAELHRLSDESAVVGKLQSTEALVRLQAEEKKRLLEQLAYYKKLLKAAGLLPPSPPISRGVSLTNIPSTVNGDSALSDKPISRIPRRASSTPRLNNSATSDIKQPPRPDDDGELQEHVQGLIFRQQHFTPDKVRGALQQMKDQGSAAGQVPPEAPENRQVEDTGVRKRDENHLQAMLKEYRAEVQMFGRPMELKQKLDLLSADLNDTQEKLNLSLECNQELENSYHVKLEEKDVIIDELEEKIRQLELMLKAGLSGRDLSGGGFGDHSGSSITLELPGSRPPSSLHSVPVERTSSRVVSLSDAAAPHDRSTSGIGMDRSALSFSGGSAVPPLAGATASPRDLSKTFDSLLSKSGEFGNREGSGPASPSSSHTATHSAATVVDERAESQQRQHPHQSQGSRSTSAMSNLRNSLDDELSLGLLEKVAATVRGDSGFGTSRGNKGRDLSGSVASLADTLDSTTERWRRDPSAAHRYAEPPSLGGSLLPAAEIFPSQENLLNTSSETIEKVAMEQRARRPFSVESTTSPEKGRVHSPTVVTPQKASVLSSPVNSNEFDQTVERYEKQTSPNRQLLDRPQALSWEQAANHMFGTQAPYSPEGQTPGVSNLPHSGTSAMGTHTGPRAGDGVLSERPLSSASTQTDSEDMMELKEKLVQALNREDALKDQRSPLGEIQREFDLYRRDSNTENEELISKLSEAEADIDDQIQKRMATVEIANDLREQLAERTGALEQITEQYEEELRDSQSRLSEMSERLTHSQNEINKLGEEVGGYKSELSDTRKELDSATQQLIDSSRRYRDTAQQLSDQKRELMETREQLNRTNQILIDSSSRNKQKMDPSATGPSTTGRSATGPSGPTQSSPAALHPSAVREFQTDSLQTDSLRRTDVGTAQMELPRPSAVRALQAEITSILDTSEHIKSNIALALEQSRLDGTSTGIETRLPITAVEFYPPHSGRLNKSENNAVDQSVGGGLAVPPPVGRGARVPLSGFTLPNCDSCHESSAPPYQPAASEGHRESKDRSAPNQSSNLARPGFSQSNDPKYKHFIPGGGYDSPGSMYPPASAEGPIERSTLLDNFNRPAYPISKSGHQGSPEDSYIQIPQYDYSNPKTTGIRPPSHDTLYQPLTTGEPIARAPGHSSHTPYDTGHPTSGTQPPVIPSHSLYSTGHLSSGTQPPVIPSHSAYNTGHPSTGTQPPVIPSHSLYSTGHLSSDTQPPVIPSHSAYSTGHPASQAPVFSHPPPYNPDHPSSILQTPAHTSHSPYNLTHQGSIIETPVCASSMHDPPVRPHHRAVGAHNAEPSPYQTAYTSVQRLPKSSVTSQGPRQLRYAEGYNGLQPSELRYQDEMSSLPAKENLPSTRNPLYAISDLINYELLKKQNEESLVLLSGIEARVQGRLDSFTSASPLDNAEWCLLKELKSCADNLKKTLFAENRHITQFYIRELPDSRTPQYEEMLRAYRKLEGRYDWAKAQLTELMKVTKLDSDLVAQMKRVKAVLKASKENMKGRAYTQEQLQRRPV